MENNPQNLILENDKSTLERGPRIIFSCNVKDTFGQILETITETTLTVDTNVHSLFSKPYQLNHSFMIDGAFEIEGVGHYMFEVTGLEFSKLFSNVQKMTSALITLNSTTKQYHDATRRVGVVRSLFQSQPNTHEKEMLNATIVEQQIFRELSLAKAHIAYYEETLSPYKV